MLRDGILSRRARVERAKARALRQGGKIGPAKYKRATFEIVGTDGTVKTYGEPGDDALHLTVTLVDGGQFLPSLITHCMDGTEIPYDVLDDDGIEIWLKAHAERTVFFDATISAPAAEAHSNYKRLTDPPRSLMAT